MRVVIDRLGTSCVLLTSTLILSGLRHKTYVLYKTKKYSYKNQLLIKIISDHEMAFTIMRKNDALQHAPISRCKTTMSYRATLGKG
jgi:hypothetical protein